MSRRSWTDEEVAYIKENLTKSNQELGVALNRTPASITNKKKYLRLLNPQHRWNKREDDIIRELYFSHGAAYLTSHLNCTLSAIHSRAEKLGVRAKVRTDFDPGARFGKLTIVKKSSKGQLSVDGRVRSRYVCRCDCGKKQTVTRCNLTSGATTSCGCQKIESTQKALRKPPGYVSYKRKFMVCKYHAENRGLPFELTFEQHIELSTKNCFYCNSEPIKWNAYMHSGSKRRRNSNTAVASESVERAWVEINGIDRRNNLDTIGYTLENCVPCCTTCNIMKMALGEGQFLDHIEKISKHQKTKS